MSLASVPARTPATHRSAGPVRTSSDADRAGALTDALASARARRQYQQQVGDDADDEQGAGGEQIVPLGRLGARTASSRRRRTWRSCDGPRSSTSIAGQHGADRPGARRRSTATARDAEPGVRRDGAVGGGGPTGAVTGSAERAVAHARACGSDHHRPLNRHVDRAGALLGRRGSTGRGHSASHRRHDRDRFLVGGRRRDLGLDHSGTLPCLRRGSSSRLVRSMRRPATIFWRVSAGSMTSST